jgi:hypothetical protein
MLQEAIRRSLQTEEEDRQKREQERQKERNESQPSPSNQQASPPSPKSFFSALRPRSGSGSESSRNETTPPPTPSTTRRPSSTSSAYPPNLTIRRQPSLPDTLSTSVSIATAMHDSISPFDDPRPSISSRPNISSPLASWNVTASQEWEGMPEGSTSKRNIANDPLSNVVQPSLKSRREGGNVEERETIEGTG